MPHHLEDLLQRSIQDLTGEQAGKLRTLLCTYATIFSIGDLLVGCMDLVKHQIDTGNSHPIKHAPRRISPVQRCVMEELVGEMQTQRITEESSSP